ncbi:MAG: lipid-A-disaccharide synthase [Puniceicoccales bacterium]|nr:lipid-A-disaccharide synthase [Puniceicoccales bacterium]
MKNSKFDLESHIGKKVDLVIIAGEHSGDQHAAEMLVEIKKIRPGINVVAFGGSALRDAGADVILDMTKFSVVGLYEVLRNFFFFTKLIKQVFFWIKSNHPRAVCLIDYPGFNIRLAQMLFDGKLSQKAGGDIKVLYYISPQIWAWKPKRCYKMAKFVDKMATIFPFEKDWFKKTNLDVSFVGHPFVADSYKLNITYNPRGPVLLLPGSRCPAVKKIFPLLLDSFNEILKHRSECTAIVVYPDETILAILRKILNRRFSKLLDKITFVPDGDSIDVCAAIMSSGTMSLKCCLKGIPGAIVYKTHPLTYVMGKMLVNVKHLGIANILLNRCVWREFIQSQLKPKSVAKYILPYIDDEKLQHPLRKVSKELEKILSAGKDMSVAKWLLSAIE